MVVQKNNGDARCGGSGAALAGRRRSFAAARFLINKNDDTADDYMKAAYVLTFDPLELCLTQKSIGPQFRQPYGETYVVGTGRS